MRRRDLKEGMRVVLCTRPWARRVLRKPYKDKWDYPEQEWITKQGALIHCIRATVLNLEQRWELDAKWNPVQVNEGSGILVEYKTHTHVPKGRKKSKRVEVLEKNVVKTLEILMLLEDYIPLQENIIQQYTEVLRKMAGGIFPPYHAR